MNVLSLFDGMSCGRIALERAGIDVTSYTASEIDKHAISVSSANWGDVRQVGDVTKWREWDIDWPSIDLLIGGSPCQGFSFAGRQLAFNDPRSALFFEFVNIRNHINKERSMAGLGEVKFLLENVKMKKQFNLVISEHIGAEPVEINSSLVSATERPRLYWSNFQIKQPAEVGGIWFADVVGNDAIPMSDSWLKWWQKNGEFQTKKAYSKINSGSDKGVCMTARQYASWNGNFVVVDGKICKPNKMALARLCGAPDDYFDVTTQRQAELMVGNGWTVDVIANLLKALKK